MDTFEIVCGSCGSRLTAKKRIAGKTVACPKCAMPVLVPAITTAAEIAPRKEPPVARPTEKQKEFAKSLGVVFSETISRRELSKLIDDALARREDERFERLDQLEERESAAREHLHAEILHEMDENNPRLSSATKDQILAAFERKGEAAILITFDPEEVQDLEDLVGVKMAAAKSDNIDLETMKAVIQWAGAAMMRL